MTITVKINIESPTGKRLEKELRQYPEVVEFVESPLPIDCNGNEITTISFGESAKPSTPGKHPETNNNNSNAGWTSCHPRPTTEKGSPAPKKK